MSSPRKREPTALDTIREAERFAADGLTLSREPAHLAWSHHVLTVRCASCGRPAWLLFSVGSDAASILQNPDWRRAAEIVRKPCRDEWEQWPDVIDYQREVRRAVAAGLGGLADRRAVQVTRRPC